MTQILTLLGSALLIAWLAWLGYVLVMGFYRAHLTGRLVGLPRLLALPVVALGLLLDVVLNATAATLFFADPPREWLLTQRLIRYKAQPSGGWRYGLAAAICEGLLDVFDPTGDHC